MSKGLEAFRLVLTEQEDLRAYWDTFHKAWRLEHWSMTPISAWNNARFPTFRNIGSIANARRVLPFTHMQARRFYQRASPGCVEAVSFGSVERL